MTRIVFSVSGGPQDSIYNCLRRKLQREPTNAELREEVLRILQEVRAL